MQSFRPADPAAISPMKQSMPQPKKITSVSRSPMNRKSQHPYDVSPDMRLASDIPADAEEGSAKPMMQTNVATGFQYL